MSVKAGTCVLMCFAAMSLAGSEHDAERAVRELDGLEWLTETQGEKALEWVKTHNASTLAALTSESEYPSNLRIARQTIASGGTQIPGTRREDSTVVAGWVYTLHRDSERPRGVWRRTSVHDYSGVASPVWEDVLDVDALSRSEGHDWEFTIPAQACRGGSAPRCIVRLADARGHVTSYREFDLQRLGFVSGGFSLSQPDVLLAWSTHDALLVSTDFGPGTLARSGLPMTVRLWRRGESLTQATEVFRAASAADTYVTLPQAYDDPSGRRILVVQNVDTRLRASHWRLSSTGALSRLSLPPSVRFLTLYRGEWVLCLGEDWTSGGRSWPAGSVLSISLAEASRPIPRAALVWKPGPANVVAYGKAAIGGVLAIVNRNVQGRLLRFDRDDGKWSTRAVDIPDGGTLDYVSVDAGQSTAFFTFQSFLQPTTLYSIDVPSAKAKAVRALPAQFDSSRSQVEQFHAVSVDGTRVPYFLVRPRTLEFDGSTPTLIYAYGAYGASEYPQYSGLLGKLWLERGAAYVLANVRGGGELGAPWHVVKAERRFTYADLVAVANDLVARGITSPRRLGIRGMSAGGLLAGVILTGWPHLINAAVVEVAILDQFRPDLFAAAEFSNGLEFGSPTDPADRGFLLETSPMQNLSAERRLPVPFIVTSSTDTAVLPANARRFAARMEALGKPCYYYESSEGGHQIWSTPAQQAEYEALVYTYLAKQLLLPPRL